MDLALKDLGEYIAGALPQDITSTELVLDELVLHARAPSLVKIMTFLRDDVNCQFKQLMDVSRP